MYLKMFYKTFIVFCVFVSISCSSNEELNDLTTSSKEVNISYGVTLISGIVSSSNIVCLNKDDGKSNFIEFKNKSLPFSMSYKRNVSAKDVVSLSVESESQGSIKLQIFVDGKEVKSKIYTSEQKINETINYVFE